MTLDAPGQDAALNIRSVAENSLEATLGNCKNCQGKTGLAILPVTMYPAPKSMFDVYEDDKGVLENLNRLKSRLRTSEREGTWNYIRIVPAGYIYVLKKEGEGALSWESYAVGADGMLNRLPPSSLPATPDDTLLTNCRREGHSNFMPQFFCLDPETTPIAWIAFARNRWTDAVRAKMESDEEARKIRMREVDLRAAARGELGVESKVPFGQVVSAGTILSVADYTDSEFQEEFQQHLGHTLIDRSGQGAQLVANMTHASSRTEAGRGVMLLLPDAIGLAEELNLLRSQALQQYNGWEAGGSAVDGSDEDVLRPWKRQSATHVAYIEAWVKSRAESDGESLRGFWENHRLGPYTEAEFNWLHGSKVNGPPVEITDRGVRNHLTGARWVPAIDPQTGRPLQRDGAGDQLGYVELTQEALDAFRESRTQQNFDAKMKRYNKRLRVQELEDFNKLYSEQEQAWVDHIVSLDKDYAWYVRTDQLHAVLMHDFDDEKVLGHGSTSEQISEYLDDAQARLNATERVFGGGAFSEASFEELVKQFNKEPDDRTNWIATALLKDFEFIEAVIEPDPDMYSGLTAATQWGVDAWAALRARGEAIAGTAQGLTLSMQQVANRLRKDLLNTVKDGNVARIQPALNQIAQREVVWVRASALHEYLASNKQHYSINVTWRTGEYLDALYASGAGAPVFTLEGRRDGDRRQVSGQRRNARGQLNRLSRNSRLQGEIVVPLVIEKSALDKALNAPRSGGVMQVSNNPVLGHPSPPATMPKPVAEALLREKTVFRERNWSNLANREMGFTGIMVFFSIWELSSAVDDLSRTSGWEQADAVASFMGGVSGILAGGLEVAAYGAQVASRQTAPVASSLLLSRQASRALALRMGAGMLGAVGAFTDTVSSAFNAAAAHTSGEVASRNHYIASAGVLFTSASISGANVFLKWRVAVSARMGHQAAISLMRGVVLRGSAAALLGAGASTAVTGVGIVLFIAGLVWALYAAHLAHDENEKFLDRSFFGKHERKRDGRFGGPKPDGSEGLLEWMARGLDQEILALGGLAMGVHASLEWRDSWFSKDTVTISFMLGAWDSEFHVLRYRLEGHEQMPDLKVEQVPTGDLLLEAQAVPKPHEDEPSVYTFEEKLDIRNRYNAARLTWELIDISDDGVVASGEVWEKD